MIARGGRCGLQNAGRAVAGSVMLVKVRRGSHACWCHPSKPGRSVARSVSIQRREMSLVCLHQQKDQHGGCVIESAI
jgi:hypothetical protein